jgi:rfaE bifunctional protein kinase chain/domain
VVSDYGKGVVQEDCLKEAIACWRDAGKPVLVDPHVGHFQWYRRASVITPNAMQAKSFFGASLGGEQSLERIGFEMRRVLELDALLITRGEEGMSLFTGGDRHLHVPTVAREVFDVTGAGDTVISVLAAGLGSGVPLIESVILSNQAAGEAVKEVGTATVSCEKLVAAFA